MVAQYAAAGTNKAGLGVGVAAFYVFLAFYSVGMLTSINLPFKSTINNIFPGVDVCGVVFYAELFPNHIRAKGICLCVATIAITDLVYLQATATAFANIGWKFYLVSLRISHRSEIQI